MRRLSVLILERDRTRAHGLAEALEASDLRIRIASGADEALHVFEEDPPDVVVTESMAADMDGQRLLDEVRERWPRLLPVVLVVVLRNTATLAQVVRQAAARRHRRMSGLAVYVGRDGQLIAEQERESGDACVQEILGRSACMEGIRRQILHAAASDLPVLLTGETGTGKDLAARAIHRLSDCCKKPFIKHNCATSLPQLLEGQFFGSCEGSFTGATEDRRGLLELAHGGVLFLDELEALDSGLQAKLLCAIEDQEIWPVGAAGPKKVSVRFLAATNRDPSRMMAQGTLREDLYYRLRGIEIHLRPLREHREDILLLAEYFLGSRAGMLTPGALGKLMAGSNPRILVTEPEISTGNDTAGSRCASYK